MSGRMRDPVEETAFWQVVETYGVPRQVAEYELELAFFDLVEEPGWDTVQPGEPRDPYLLAMKRLQQRQARG